MQKMQKIKKHFGDMENCGSFKVYVASSHDVNKNSKVSEKKTTKLVCLYLLGSKYLGLNV